MYDRRMGHRRIAAAMLCLLAVVSCSASSAQSRENEALRKELEALKASQAEMQKSLDEIRTFLTAATGGRFGRPSVEGASIETTAPSVRKALLSATNGCPSTSA